MDHCRLAYHAPAISSASSFEDERGHVCQFGPWEGEGIFLHLVGERDPRFALAAEDHPGIRLRRVCKEFTMAKLDIHESLLAAPNLQSVVAGLQIMQHVRGLVNHDVTVRVLGFVSGPPHVRIVSGETVAPHLDIIRLEPMIPEKRPELAMPIP